MFWLLSSFLLSLCIGEHLNEIKWAGKAAELALGGVASEFSSYTDLVAQFLLAHVPDSKVHAHERRELGIIPDPPAGSGCEIYNMLGYKCSHRHCGVEDHRLAPQLVNLTTSCEDKSHLVITMYEDNSECLTGRDYAQKNFPKARVMYKNSPVLDSINTPDPIACS